MERLTRTLTYGLIVGITKEIFPMLTYDVDEDGNRVKRRLHQRLILAKHVAEKSFQTHLETYEGARTDIMDEYVDKDEDGKYKTETIPNGDGRYRQPFIFKSNDAKEEFQEKVLDLLNTEVEVEVMVVPLELFPEQIEEDIVTGCAFMIEEYSELIEAGTL